MKHANDAIGKGFKVSGLHPSGPGANRIDAGSWSRDRPLRPIMQETFSRRALYRHRANHGTMVAVILAAGQSSDYNSGSKGRLLYTIPVWLCERCQPCHRYRRGSCAVTMP
jgi:hypothetical protein